MRKLFGSWAKLTSPVIAAAIFTGGCADQQSATQYQSQVEKGQVPDAVQEVLSLCGYELECKSFADGQVNISGNRVVDAFFSASANLSAEAAQLEASVTADLGNIAAILGLDVAANASIEELSTAISAEISGGFGGMVDGNITLDFQPPKCEVTAKATLEAAAKCDAEVDPGSAEVECKGECVAEANVMAECSGNVTLMCKGTAPSFECSGMCQGTCQVDAGAACSGECKGTCMVEAEADCDGEFVADAGGAMGAGTCNVRSGAKCGGTCMGTCELNAAATCEGQCKGECTYEAPSGGCTGGAEASCEASADASVMCKGECRGEVEPPMVMAECQASAKAEADLNAECTPPSVGLSYSLSADAMAAFEADASAQAAFEAKLEAFANAYGALLAKGAKIEIVANAGVGLADAAVNAVGGLAGGLVDGDGDIQAKFDGFCAVGQLDAAGSAIADAGTSLQASGEGILAITTAIGG